MKVTKNKYLAGFGVTVIILAIVRCAFPSVAEKNELFSDVDTVKIKSSNVDDLQSVNCSASVNSRFFDRNGNIVKHKIWSVSSYAKSFPDSNNVQLECANKYGVSPVDNREDAEHRKNELVYIDASPFFHVDHLKQSIPYLVPKAAVLLNDIGRAYFDSLQIKGIPLHKFIVTSVLRTRDDVKRLRNYNRNATENSCHLYGTTFDICYNRYITVQHPDGPKRNAVRNDSLKWVLSEVLRDMRQQKRCYVKYEVKQGCFHITVR